MDHFALPSEKKITSHMQPVPYDTIAHFKDSKRLRIAVVGGGVAGVTAAYLLDKDHQVTLYEKNSYIGGHTHTAIVPNENGGELPVDMGFIVMNQENYPLFNRLLDQLGVGTALTDMSFSFFNLRTGFTYASRNLNTLFAQRANLFSPRFWVMAAGILKFNRISLQELEKGTLTGLSIRDYVKIKGFNPITIKDYLIPMAAAIWSSSDADVLNFPVERFLRFFKNHGLLSISNHPKWQYIPGGSHTYIKSFLDRFTGRVRKACPVTRVHRVNGEVIVEAACGVDIYDAVIMAAHADEAMQMIDEPTPDEVRLLSPWSYSRNRVLLHTDTTVMPPARRAWSSWNYTRESHAHEPVMVSYHMNQLQKLPTSNQYIVTLNPFREPLSQRCLKEIEMTHPSYTNDTIASQDQLNILNGRTRIFFCGAYFGYGFHEDAVKSAVNVAKHFGKEL